MALNGRAAIVVAALASLLVPSTAGAQAWVLLAGEGTASVIYHHAFVRDHVFARGERHDVGHVRTQLLTADIEYGVTDRLTIRGLVPYVAAKYSGDRPHRFGAEPPRHFHMLDDGTTHAAFQDVRVEARYGWREFPVAIAPFVALSIPTHDYEVFAHSAVGFNMVELQLGAHAGVLRGPFAIHGRYAFGFYERVIGRRRNRSVIDAEVGWLASSRIRLALFQATQISHGGVDLPLNEVLDRTIARHDWWPHHDQIARANTFNVGGGLSVRLTPSVSLHASLLRTLTGRNTHATKYGLTAGSTWAFGTPRAPHATPNRP